MAFEIDEGNELSFDMIGNMSDEEIAASKAADKDKEKEIITEDEEVLFPETGDEEDNPEGVGDENQEDEEETIPATGGKSPNFYASIATSLKGDGILTLDDSEFENIENADDLAALFRKQTDKLLDDNQKRINEALSYDVPVDTVKQFENVLTYVKSITEEDLQAETPEAEQLRGNILVQDYMNKGFSQERANKEVKKAFEAGTDIEDALESLKEVKEFYTSKYTEVINSAKAEKENKLKDEREQSKQIEKKFLEVEEPIKGVKLTENERKKILTQYTKFTGKDKSNRPVNAIQEYAMNNPVDYQYNINLLYYLTDGFKDFGKVIQKEVKTKTKSTLSNLEKTLRNPSNNLGGGNSLSFDNDRSKESYQGISVDLD